MAIWLIDDEQKIEICISGAMNLEMEWKSVWEGSGGKSQREALLRNLIASTGAALAVTVGKPMANVSLEVTTDSFGNIYRLLPHGGVEVLGQMPPRVDRSGGET